jgi:hypothetical protein
MSSKRDKDLVNTCDTMDFFPVALYPSKFRHSERPASKILSNESNTLPNSFANNLSTFSDLNKSESAKIKNALSVGLAKIGE